MGAGIAALLSFSPTYALPSNSLSNIVEHPYANPKVDTGLFDIKWSDGLKAYTLIYNPGEHNVNDMLHAWYNHPIAEVRKKGPCPDSEWNYQSGSSIECLDSSSDVPDLIKYIMDTFSSDKRGDKLLTVRYWGHNNTATIIFDPVDAKDAKFIDEMKALLQSKPI